MPPKRRRTRRTKRKYHLLLILVVVIAGIFFLIQDFGREERSRRVPDKIIRDNKTGVSRTESLPRIAVVMDDLGTSRELAEGVLSIDSPITFSILPQQPYSEWISREGKRLGRDVIIHLPMEASKPLKLGEGGLYSWMSDEEIRQTAEADIESVPYRTGASNHMGSALTADKRAMHTVMKVVKKHRLFFLDSLTTPESLAYERAETEGLTAYRRDVFLDNTDDHQDMQIQWDRLMEIARKRGHAILLAHPKEATLAFLRKALRDSKEVTVVPISDLPPG